MRFLIGAMGLALLAGCANVSDTRSNPPLVSVTSSKSPQELAECIRDGWQGIAVLGSGYGAILQSSGNRFSVFSPDSATPWHIADVSPSNSGAAVSYHFYRTWQSPPESVITVIKRCAT
ncbi:hypothetical protein [Pseudomonas sp. AP-1]|uniref:hypothetical protein n=1 Tax=Pseudomonas sp. AP-1 TaxID=3231718 RepID=UPI0035ADA150